MSRILIGGVGYRNLRDHSFGVVLVDELALREWPPAVCVEDISYNPIAVVQRLQDEPANRPFEVAILVGALQRPGRTPGTLTVYRWDHVLPAPEAIHEAITEAVTGIISLDNTLIIAGHFNALPANVVVIELEPDAHEFGDQLTPSVAAALARTHELVSHLAHEPSATQHIPEGSLIFGRVRHSGVVFGQVIDGSTRVH